MNLTALTFEASAAGAMSVLVTTSFLQKRFKSAVIAGAIGGAALGLLGYEGHKIDKEFAAANKAPAISVLADKNVKTCDDVIGCKAPIFLTEEKTKTCDDVIGGCKAPIMLPK